MTKTFHHTGTTSSSPSLLCLDDLLLTRVTTRPSLQTAEHRRIPLSNRSRVSLSLHQGAQTWNCTKMILQTLMTGKSSWRKQRGLN
ncbi:hypothetical protein L1987_37187 [Smallanthus sonchifolius]|uniref:Uncharacterized protein n=1 Tax=Smallanthus sonchifolius TaxID=185202 RepID=A0ACB9HHF6_9ASTR|nr:hypothetical protein L1987_37187 [Smallanthus sonchifolius]